MSNEMTSEQLQIHIHNTDSIADKLESVIDRIERAGNRYDNGIRKRLQDLKAMHSELQDELMFSTVELENRG